MNKSVVTDGKKFGGFRTYRRVSQGCVVSPMLFNIIMDTTVRTLAAWQEGEIPKIMVSVTCEQKESTREKKY